MAKQAILFTGGPIEFSNGTERQGLFVSDGAAGGTSPISVDIDDSASYPPDFTDLDGEVLFEGIAADGTYGLFETKGTEASTVELAASGTAPDAHITVVGKKAFFIGGGGDELFVTDGTKSGTKALKVFSSTNDDPELAALNGKVFFEAPDKNSVYTGNEGLWVSDGTAGGTKDIAVGVFDGFDADPDYLLLGDKLIFQNYDGKTGAQELFITGGTASSTRALLSSTNTIVGTPSDFKLLTAKTAIFIANAGQLWITNGTSAGTKRLTSVEDKIDAPSGEATPYDIVTTGGKAYFLDVGKNGQWGLFETNGTASGTQELAAAYQIDVGYQYTEDADYGDKATYLTVVDGKVYFEGAQGGLWVTDGTQAGTKELTDLVGPIDGAAVGDKFVFTDGNMLWETNGTATGTEELGAGLGGGGDFTSVSLPTLPPARAVHNGTTDLYLQEGSKIVDWSFHDGFYKTANVVSSNAAHDDVVGYGDLNGDKSADLLVQTVPSVSGTDAVVYDWTLVDGRYKSAGKLGTLDGTNAVVGTGDLFGNGTDDVILQDQRLTGPEGISEWKIEDGKRVSTGVIKANSGGFRVVGTGDFNGDGTTDLLVQKGSTLEDWIMSDGHIELAHVISNIGSYTVVGTGDFNGDGTTDIVLQDNATVVDWTMHNGTLSSKSAIATDAPSYVAATGDFNGDGTTDLAFATSGTITDWTIKNGHFSSSQLITTSGESYTVKA